MFKLWNIHEAHRNTTEESFQEATIHPCSVHSSGATHQASKWIPISQEGSIASLQTFPYLHAASHFYTTKFGPLKQWLPWAICLTALLFSHSSVSSKASPDFTLVTKFFPNNPWQSGRKAVHSGDRCWGHGLTSTETSPWLKETTQHIVNKTQDTWKCSQSKTLTSLYIRLGYACILRCIMMCTHTCFIHVSTITSEGLFCHRILGCPPCPV